MQKESEKDTHHKVGVYLDGYARLIANAEFYATLKPSMDEGERMDAQMAYIPYEAKIDVSCVSWEVCSQSLKKRERN